MHFDTQDSVFRIIRKKEEQNMRSGIKKTGAAVMALILLSFTGNTAMASTGGMTGLANPFRDCETLSDAEKTAGFSFALPEELMTAGTWEKNDTGWWFRMNSGEWPSDQWKWIRGKCYFFDREGYCLTGGKTPDGYDVNEKGEWTENGAAVSYASKGELAGYSLDVIQAIEGDLAQAIFRDGESEILVRKAEGTDDVTGDYRTYERTETETVNGNTVTIHGNGGKWSNASWVSDGYAFAVVVKTPDDGIGRDAILAVAGGTE